METIYYKQADFNKFPWNLLELREDGSNIGKNFSFGKGGNHYPHGSGWHIIFYSGTSRESQWELPSALSNFIDWKIKESGEEKMTELRRFIGVK